MSHPLPPLPPEALESENTQQDSVVPAKSSYELSPDIQEMSRSVQELTNASNYLSLQGNSSPSAPRSSREFPKPLKENYDAESIGHESTGGRSRSSREYNRSPNKLSKPIRKEVPGYDEFMPPPRISSRTQTGQRNDSPVSTTRRSLDHGQDFAPTNYGNSPVPPQAGSINASPRPRPARTAPLDEPITSREVPERRPRSQYPEALNQHVRSHSQSQHSLQSSAQLGPNPQYSQPQPWGPQQRPQDEREFLAGEGDGFYGNTGGNPYAGPYNDSAMYGQAEPRHPSPALLDQSHLQPGDKAALLSNEQSLALYRANAKKSSNPEIVFEFAAFMLEASKSVVVPPADATYSNQLEIDRANEKREAYIKEAMGLLKKIADRGHVLAQYTLADCYSNGIGTIKGRQDFDRAFPLFVAAAKHNHVDGAYRAGACCEYGWGCRKDSAKAAHFYRAAASQGHPGSMFRLGQAEMNGELGLAKNAKEGVRWLQRSAENATAEFPHALHELALCHEKGVHNVIFVDLDYAAELLGQASELGYAPSAYRLGEAYEYGNLGCQPDPALSIHYYVRATSLQLLFLVLNPDISSTEYSSPTESPRGLLFINGLVSCWVSGSTSSVRHRSLPLGETSSGCWPGEGPVCRCKVQ
jgi:TPR repeat protein